MMIFDKDSYKNYVAGGMTDAQASAQCFADMQAKAMSLYQVLSNGGGACVGYVDINGTPCILPAVCEIHIVDSNPPFPAWGIV